MRCARLNPDIKRYIRSLYSFAIQPDGQLPVTNVSKQEDSFNCGLYAIAYVTNIMAGLLPVSSKYEVDKMRQHLITF